MMVIMHSLQKVREIGQKLGIQPEVIRGTDLQDKGFGGMWILWTVNTLLHRHQVLIFLHSLLPSSPLHTHPHTHPHPHTSLLSRYLWCWSGCCASSSPGCPQPPAPGGRGDHLLGRQGHCLRHWRTLHQNQGGTAPLCTTLTTNLVLSNLTLILFDTLDWDARNEERLWRGSCYPGSILRGCQTGRAHATSTLLTTLALTPEE